ncbi:MAG: hypothetical protein JWP13_396 [Candidatus Saccharibacteria bacterium]|nr:hypothetical protein [Candidatus Saccharibacteria bacterium]
MPLFYYHKSVKIPRPKLVPALKDVSALIMEDVPLRGLLIEDMDQFLGGSTFTAYKTPLYTA